MKQFFLIFLVWMLAAPASGQTLEVGETVVVIANADLQTLDGSAASVFPGVPLTIEEIRESQAGEGTEVLVSNGTPGWLDSRFVKLPDQALAYFDEQLQATPDDKDWLMARTMTLAATDKHEEAIAGFSQLLESSPDDTGLLNERAGSLMALGEFEQAISDFDRLIDAQPLGTLHNNRALCHQALGNVNSARLDFRKAMQLDPSLTATYLNLGKLEAGAGNGGRARDYFDKYVEAFPQSADSHIARAEFCISVQDFKGALPSLEQAVRLRPDELQLHAHRAMVLRDLGRTDEAIAAFGEMIQQFPDSPVGYINRAVLRKSSGQLQAAVTDFDRALELDPDSAYCFFQRGNVHLALQNHEAAIKDLTRAIELEPRSTAFERRGEARARLGQDDKALEDFDRALEDDPNRHFARYRRAAIYQARGDVDKAYSDYSRLVNAGVRSVAVFYNRSRILRQRQEWDRAITDLESAVQIDAESVLAINALAWALAAAPQDNLRQPDRAIELANRACELSAWQRGVIMDTLATAYAAAGQFDAAVEMQQRALQMSDAGDNQGMEDRLELFQTEQAFVDKD